MLLVTPKPWMMVGIQNPIVLLELTKQKKVIVRSHTAGPFSASPNPCWRGPALLVICFEIVEHQPFLALGEPACFGRACRPRYRAPAGPR